jgi:hypothetical protein
MKDKFSAVLKIAAQAFPLTGVLAQWLSEIEAAEIEARVAHLEDPLADYGPNARELCRVLYAMVKALPQDRVTNHVDWTPELQPFMKVLRHFDADRLVIGSHAMGSGGAFAAGFRITAPFAVYLATLHEDPATLAGVMARINDAVDSVSGFELQRSTGLPLMVVDALFADFERRGQGVTSKTIGASVYIPHR